MLTNYIKKEPSKDSYVPVYQLIQLNIVTLLQIMEQIYRHIKYNRLYTIVSMNAKMKLDSGEWVECVIYKPMYENPIEMFSRRKESFLEEFELVESV